MRTFVHLLFLSLLLPFGAWAAEFQSVVGWSADGTRFVYTVKDFARVPWIDGLTNLEQENWDEWDSADLGVVHDARTGEETHYLLKLRKNRRGPSKMRTEWGTLPDAKAFSGFVKENKVRCPSAALSESSFSAQAFLETDGQPHRGWDGSASIVVELGNDRGTPYSYGVVGEAGRRVVDAGVWRAGIRSFQVYDVEMCWSPHGRRIAWVQSVAGRTGFRGYSEGGYHLQVVPTGVWVQVFANADIAEQILPPIVHLMEQVGYAPKLQGEAKKTRETSTIYVANGYEDHAATIAGMIPGGANVEALDWTTDAQIVVAVGASAVP